MIPRPNCPPKCEKRCPGCHGRCDTYINYKSNLEAYKETIQAKKSEEHMIASYKIKNIERANKLCGRKTYALGRET